MDQEILRVFLLWCAVCSSYTFLPELKVRIRTAIETINADMLQTISIFVLMFVESQSVHI